MSKLVFILLTASLFFLFPSKVSAADVVINEFLSNPPSGSPEWVEFYNTTNTTVDLSDYYFDDDTNFNSDSGSSAKIALSGLLSSFQTCFLEMSSYLNNNGDSPTLFDTGSSIVDTYTYSSSSAGLSYARIPDGGSWIGLQQPTKSSNECIDLAPTPTPTPTNTPTPTDEPTPTKTPTPTKKITPTPTKKPTPTPTRKLSEKEEGTDDLFVAGETKIALDKSPTPEAQVLGEKTSRQPFIFIGLGIIFLAVCGIFAYLQFGDKIFLWKKKSL